MIWLYTGTPGSGKSLDMARDICMKLRQGKTVIGNFPINAENVKKCKGNYIYKNDEEMTVKWLTQYAMENHVEGREGQTLVCIDEAQIKFNCRDFGVRGRIDWVKFFCLHRHLGYNVILACQNDRMLDKQIRALVEYDVKHKKLNKNGFGGWLLMLTGKTWFISIEYWYGSKMVLSKRMFAYNKKYANIYNSYRMFADLIGEENCQPASGVTGGTACGGAPGEPEAGCQSIA